MCKSYSFLFDGKNTPFDSFIAAYFFSRYSASCFCCSRFLHRAEAHKRRYGCAVPCYKYPSIDYLLEVALDADREDRDVAAGGDGLVHEPRIDDLLVFGERARAHIAAVEVLRLGLELVALLTGVVLRDRLRALPVFLLVEAERCPLLPRHLTTLRRKSFVAGGAAAHGAPDRASSSSTASLLDLVLGAELVQLRLS